MFPRPFSFFLFPLIVLVFGVSAQASPNATLHEYADTPKKETARLKTIVIDAGHGGKDDGAVGQFQVKEKDVVLAIALRLQRILTRSGFRTLLVRHDDRYLSLQERTQIVNANDADFFLSIHANAASNKLARGHEVYYLADPKNDAYDPEKMQAEDSPGYEHFLDDQKELGKLYLSLLDKASGEDRAECIELGERINDAMRERLGSRNRGVKRARFFVLKRTDIPAVLIEVGFLSNPKEERLLATAHYQRRIAQAIAEGLIAFRNKQNSAGQGHGK